MIYKFKDVNGNEITVNSLSGLQGLVDSDTIKKDTKVKAGLRGNWTTAENISELVFNENIAEEETSEDIAEPEEDIRSFITKDAIKKQTEEVPKEETEDIVDFINREPTPPPKVTEKFKKGKIVEIEKSNEEVDKELRDFIHKDVEKIPETESVEKEIEDTLPEKPEKGKDKPHEIIGGILIAIGVADFALYWFGINLTFFLPPDISRFSPIAFGVVGGIIMNAGDK